jgi:uncharacterized DUF497 family protein
MAITFDPAKRATTLERRGIDFATDAKKVFAGRTATWDDDRRDYGERRLITAGYLGARMVVMVWTPRGAARHIISMRFAHDKEVKKVVALYKSLA